MRGFTLLEIVVVLSLLGVIAAGVAPALVHAGRQDDLATAANHVAQLIRTARMAALERGASVTLTLETASGRYLVEQEADGAVERLAEGRLDLAGRIGLSATRPVLHLAFDRVGSSVAESIAVHGGGGGAVVGVDGWSGEPYVRLLGAE